MFYHIHLYLLIQNDHTFVSKFKSFSELSKPRVGTTEKEIDSMKKIYAICGKCVRKCDFFCWCMIYNRHHEIFAGCLA